MIQREGTFDPYHPTEAGQTLRGDHAYAFYQIPENARKYPIVFLHGHGQSAKTWETTPDGREGFQNIFLRKGFSVYLVDQPRRGDAGKATESYTIEAKAQEQDQVFDVFRLGIWPDYFDNVQFERSEETFDQFCRQCTPNTADWDLDIVSDGITSVTERVGDCILVTHSMGGGVGWQAAMKSDKIKAIVSYEPGSNFAFPEGEVPPVMPASCGPLYPLPVSVENFDKMAKIPIIIYYGDNFPSEPTDNPGQDQWRVRLDMARIFEETVNRHGGDAKVVHLPTDCHIYGNTHFPFADLNNLEIADLMYQFLEEKGLV